jgi:hypothetical protein
VYGCNLAKLKFVSIVELEDMIEEAWDDVREANAELLRVRAEIYRKENKLPKSGEKDSNNDQSKHEYNEDKKVSDDSNLISSIPEEEEAPTSDIESIKPAQLERNTTSGSLSSGIRQRPVPSARVQYNMAQSMVRRMQGANSTGKEKPKKKGWFGTMDSSSQSQQQKKKVISILDHPSYAVVTFTSRQAAIAARQCLADGKGVDRWMNVDGIPVTPLGKFCREMDCGLFAYLSIASLKNELTLIFFLNGIPADAPPRNILFCRGCW